MRITLADRFRALFAKDKEDFWFDHFTDDEKKLLSMDSWDLAKVIHEEKRNSVKGIAAEHMLQVRLVKMQNSATYMSILFSLIGVVIGVVLTVVLT